MLSTDSLLIIFSDALVELPVWMRVSVLHRYELLINLIVFLTKIITEETEIDCSLLLIHRDKQALFDFSTDTFGRKEMLFIGFLNFEDEI